MDMFEHCEILTEKLKQNGFENHSVSSCGVTPWVKKSLSWDGPVNWYALVNSEKKDPVYIASTPEMLDDYIDFMILQKGDAKE